jgi:geranylgeranylglycerol-phosphate geranylgeranyltransferase
MPPSLPASLSLVRPGNLLLAAVGVAVGGFLAMGSVAWPRELIWAALSGVLLGACGNIANDIADIETDRINRPRRPLPSGAISPLLARLLGGASGGFGLALAWLTGPEVFAIGLAALAVMLLYSPLIKQFGAPGNAAVAVVGSVPLVYGAAAAGYWRAGLVPAAIAAILHFAREVVKDLEDVAGDAGAGRRTIPVALGEGAGFTVAAATLVVFVPVSLAPWFAGLYGQRYGLAVVALNAGVAVLIARLLSHRLGGASAALKAAMLAGLFALLWDRL